jgi:signal transduction histidine kinase
MTPLWRRFWPDSLLGRTLLVLLGGIVVSNAIGLAVYSGERLALLTSDRGRLLAERVAAAVDALEQSAGADRAQVIRTLRGPGLWLNWSLRPAARAPADDWRIRPLRRALIAELGDVTPDRVRLSFGSPADDPDADRGPGDRVFPPGRGWGVAPPPGVRPEGPGFGPGWMRRGTTGAVPAEDLLVGSVQLSDGSWLNFFAPHFALTPVWEAPFFIITITTLLVIMAVSIWAVRRAAQPLSMFAEAAERVGRDLDAAPLPETGPSEVRKVSRAFNDMQRRLQRFVGDRTQMLAAISHDLRTPITRLRLRAEFIDNDDQRQKMLSDLDEIEAMITGTLAFARNEAAREPTTAVDLAVLVQSVCDEAEDAGASAAYAGPAHLAFVGRPVALRRAFANLVDNAAKYGGGARVTLTADPRVVTVCVDDDGPGIPEREQEKVFDPFYRIEGSRSRDTGGVGLGLAVVRSAVRAHGGEVTLQNRAEGGLRVSVILPQPGPPAAGA